MEGTIMVQVSLKGMMMWGYLLYKDRPCMLQLCTAMGLEPNVYNSILKT